MELDLYSFEWFESLDEMFKSEMDWFGIQSSR